MKSYFIYAKPVLGLRCYIGKIDCDHVETHCGVHLFYIGSEIIAIFVEQYTDIEDRTED